MPPAPRRACTSYAPIRWPVRTGTFNRSTRLTGESAYHHTHKESISKEISGRLDTSPMRDLVLQAQMDAERATPAVKTAALLHIARVLTKIDVNEAERTLDEALALAATLPDGEREILLGEGAALAATVSPPRALHLVREFILDRDSVLERVLFNMAAHGRATDAAAYLSDPIPGEAYPYAAA